MKERNTEMRTLKQVNAHYQDLGYAVERNARGAVEVRFEGESVWTIPKGRTVAQVAETMADMPWLAWGVTSCELPERVITVQYGDGWSITTNHRGHCVEFDGYAVDVVPNSAVAIANINNGVYLTPGECCPVVTHYSSVVKPSAVDEMTEALRWMYKLNNADDHIPSKPCYLSEADYQDTKHLMEF